eukprot:8217222-Pyramimonas_sp.AAC.1
MPVQHHGAAADVAAPAPDDDRGHARKEGQRPPHHRAAPRERTLLAHVPRGRCTRMEPGLPRPMGRS